MHFSFSLIASPPCVLVRETHTKRERENLNKCHNLPDEATTAGDTAFTKVEQSNLLNQLGLIKYVTNVQKTRGERRSVQSVVLGRVFASVVRFVLK